MKTRLARFLGPAVGRCVAAIAIVEVDASVFLSISDGKLATTVRTSRVNIRMYIGISITAGKKLFFFR